MWKHNLHVALLGATIGGIRGYHGVNEYTSNKLHKGNRNRAAIHGAIRGASHGVFWLGQHPTYAHMAATLIGGEVAGHYAGKAYDHYNKRGRLDRMSPLNAIKRRFSRR